MAASAPSAHPTPTYRAVTRFRASQKLDLSPEIGRRIAVNRVMFDEFVAKVGAELAKEGVEDCAEITKAIGWIEQAKDAVGRARIHSIASVSGVPFEQAAAVKA